jgi:hypothetical protein
MITVRRSLSACALAAIFAMPHAAIAGDMLLIHGHIKSSGGRSKLPT